VGGKGGGGGFRGSTADDIKNVLASGGSLTARPASGQLRPDFFFEEETAQGRTGARPIRYGPRSDDACQLFARFPEETGRRGPCPAGGVILSPGHPPRAFTVTNREHSRPGKRKNSAGRILSRSHRHQRRPAHPQGQRSLNSRSQVTETPTASANRAIAFLLRC